MKPLIFMAGFLLALALENLAKIADGNATELTLNFAVAELAIVVFALVVARLSENRKPDLEAIVKERLANLNVKGE